MISIYDIKPQFQNVLRPIVQGLAKIGVTPNQVTMAAVFLSLVTGGLLTVFHENRFIFILIPIVMFVRMALNAIDGMLAKEHDMKTALGNMLNELGDVFSDAFLFIPFAFVTGFRPELIVLVVLLSIISEMAGVLGVVIGASRRYDGPMGKSDRAFVFGLLAVLLLLDWASPFFVNIVLAMTAALIFLNIVIRMQRALKEVA